MNNNSVDKQSDKWLDDLFIEADAKIPNIRTVKQQILDHFKDYKSPAEVEKMIIEASKSQFTKEEIAYLVEVLEWQKMSYDTAPQDLRLSMFEIINVILIKLNELNGGKI